MNQKLDTETRLLLLCVRPHLNDETLEMIRNFIQKENIDWKYLLGISITHNVFPLLYRTLKSLQQDAIPQTIMSSLKYRYIKNAMENLFRMEELIMLLELFKKNGISALPLKGPILASYAYEDIALRQFIDLDILIEKQNVLKARNLLVEVGYSLPIQLSDDQISHLLRDNNEIFFYCKKKGLIIYLDIHWSLLQGYYKISYPFEQLWDHRCIHNLNRLGVPVMCLCPEDLFITTCMHHGVKEKWFELKLICDLIAVIHTYKQMDWQKIIKKTNRLGIDLVVWVGLSLAYKLFDLKLPPSIPQKISEDSYVNSITLRIFKQLINKSNNKTQSISGILARRIFHFHIHNKRDLLSRLLFKFYRMTQPTVYDIVLISLPSYFYFVYYLIIRPFRIVKDILIEIKSLFKRAFRNKK